MKDAFVPNTPIICLISDGLITTENYDSKSLELISLIRSAVSAKIELVQIREKTLPAGLLFDLVSRALQETRNSITKILVNERLDIALAAGADGVHLTSKSMPVSEIRNICPSDFVIGRSAHSLAEAMSAAQSGANFVLLGPVFATPSKARFGEALGLGVIRRVCEELPGFPVLALGGIGLDNYNQVLECGARGFGAIRFLSDPNRLRSIAEQVNLSPKNNL